MIFKSADSIVFNFFSISFFEIINKIIHCRRNNSNNHKDNHDCLFPITAHKNLPKEKLTSQTIMRVSGSQRQCSSQGTSLKVLRYTNCTQSNYPPHHLPDMFTKSEKSVERSESSCPPNPNITELTPTVCAIYRRSLSYNVGETKRNN